MALPNVKLPALDDKRVFDVLLDDVLLVLKEDVVQNGVQVIEAAYSASS